jgi:hypothetical protein
VRYEYDLLVEIREMSDHLLVMELYIDTRILEQTSLFLKIPKSAVNRNVGVQGSQPLPCA